ncbi:hypothetical protein EAI_08565 [Harpegnathos saltator]|uniref:Uncharacterized protein n=1 Tax=Harpegnathos saltator TaxID=610380 RepID=E2BAQ5_HARSA|nr:hypothetical protein EAI_08565 [Harpegnathos saltator]
MSSPTIYKCCRHDEGFQSSEDPNELPRCQPSLEQWHPLIYSLKKNTFMSNAMPPQWRIVDGVIPKCDTGHDLIHVPYRKANPFLLLDAGGGANDGHAMIDSNNLETQFPPSQYCGENVALLVCVQKKPNSHAAATMRPRVRRCCGENATFHEHGNTCVHLKEMPDAPPLLPNTNSAIEIIAGFPTCPKSDNFTILGDAKDAVLQPDGGLEIKGVSLPAGQFCVERIKELNQIAKVFACPEHAPQRSVDHIHLSHAFNTL